MDRLVVVPPPHEEEGPKEPTPTPVEVLHELHSYIQTLAESGLSLDVTTLTPDMVEQVLMTDARMCELCGSTSETVCPQSGKPHRRHLVVVAQQVLRCLGRAVGRLVARPARVAERMGGSGRVRTERRIVVNPQLFLLSFYFATLPADDVDPLTGECAKHLVEVLQQVKDYGARTEVDETYATALLKSLRRAWLQYQRRAGPQAAPTEPSRQREATEELLRGTREAIVAAAQQLRRSNPPDSSLQQFIALLMERLSRIASEEVIKEVEEELHSIAEQPHEESLLRSPDIQSSKPPQLLSDTNTSGSELDLPPQSPPRERLGPDLPPNWEVDETGRSRPSAGQKEREEREKFLLQEFKARKAYEAAMQVTSPASAEEKLKKELSAAIGEAQLLELARRLNLPSPDLEMIPYMLKVVEESFVEALPQRIRPRAQQEFRDVLDWSIVRRSVKGDAANISNVLMFVVGKIIDYGAPAREAELREKSAEVSTALTNAAPDVGTAVANAFRFLMESIRQLRADVAQYTLSLISAELKANAVNYIRGFVKSCMPITAKWTSSIAFLQRFMAEPRVKDWAESAQAQSTTSLTVEERYIRGALAYGSLFLIKSGNESSTSRWSTLPGELFYFEKPTLFQCANSVQECTLLLLLEGTVSSMLNAKGQSRASIADLLKRLHTLILTLLGGDVKLEELKHLVVDFLNNALSDSSTAAKPTPVLLSDAESKAVSATIDKMVDTNSPLYTSFEKKVLAYFEGIVTTKEAPNLAPLGLVTDTLQKQAGLLKTTLQFHWEVYRPFYTELIPILAIPASG